MPSRVPHHPLLCGISSTIQRISKGVEAVHRRFVNGDSFTCAPLLVEASFFGTYAVAEFRQLTPTGRSFFRITLARSGRIHYLRGSHKISEWPAAGWSAGLDGRNRHRRCGRKQPARVRRPVTNMPNSTLLWPRLGPSLFTTTWPFFSPDPSVSCPSPQVPESCAERFPVHPQRLRSRT